MSESWVKLVFIVSEKQICTIENERKKRLVYLMLFIQQQDVHKLYDVHMIRWNDESFCKVELNDCIYPSGTVLSSKELLESWIRTIRTSVSCNDVSSLIFWVFRHIKLFCTPGNFGSKESSLVFIVYLFIWAIVCLSAYDNYYSWNEWTMNTLYSNP